MHQALRILMTVYAGLDVVFAVQTGLPCDV